MSVPQRYNIDYGVHLVDDGVAVALWAPEAERVEFCALQKAGDAWVQNCYDLENVGYGNWSNFVAGIGAGTHYGFRVHGKWDPQNGYFFNPAKLMADPYAKAIEGDYYYGEAVLPYVATLNEKGMYEPKTADGGWLISEIDSLPFVPHSVVIPDFAPNDEHRPHIQWRDTVIYETHVIGLTKLAPWLKDVDGEDLRGTYAGLGHPKTIKYLQDLGITSVELLPIHSSISEAHLLKNGLTNYWGYANLSYFAPNPEYASQSARESSAIAVIEEVREAVKALHEAGLEVILDVVYNHTCEESNAGPSLSYRGIANRQYYVHPEDDFGALYDTTGCGNSLNFRDPHIVNLALNSLRYWATTIGVDGFRYDLMVTCARGENGFTKNHPFLLGILGDPVLANLKMIAEPWDLGDMGWRTGGFGFPFSEWNDSFRNANRTFWLVDKARHIEGWSVSSPQLIATKLAGSSDIFGASPGEPIRGPLAGVNYITAHDGFTLRDLVSYSDKHNEANLEENRDGTTDNNSYNHGAEGATNDRKIRAERQKTMRNLLGMLLLSAGVPMISGGDEFGRTQFGNNNAYCQNSEVSWYDWKLEKWQKDMLETTKHLLDIRKSFPALHQTSFFTGEKRHANSDVTDLCWFRPNGELFTSEGWENSDHRAFQALFAAPHNGENNAHRDVLVVVNARNVAVDITLPEIRTWERHWCSHQSVPKKDYSLVQVLKAEPYSVHVLASI